MKSSHLEGNILNEEFNNLFYFLKKQEKEIYLRGQIHSDPTQKWLELKQPRLLERDCRRSQ